MNGKKVLFVVTSHDRMGMLRYRKTGVWLEEFVVPYEILSAGGCVIEIASPRGGEIPIDPDSLKAEPVGMDFKSFLRRNEALFHSASPLEKVHDRDYDAVFYPGGHGPLWDLAASRENARLLESFFQNGKVIAAVCHGPAALLGAKTPGGLSILNGKRVTGFSDEEERLTALNLVVPFSLEKRMQECGGIYTCGKPWQSYVVRDGNLITGQNPQSSGMIAQELLHVLRRMK